MGAIKRELERLAEIVIYGTPETIEREFRKVDELGGSLAILAQAIEMSRYIAPLCECRLDYFESLHDRAGEYVEKINKESANG
jgi:hypothetical protein